MVNITLVVTAAVFAVLVGIGAVYFVVYFQHPQDRNLAWFPKIVVIASLSLACFNIFLLPLQVANSTGLTTGSSLPMEQLTLGFYGTTVCMVLIMIPFTTYFYEGEDAREDEEGNTKTGCGGQFAYALQYIIPTVAIFAGIVAAMFYGGLAYATIPTTYLQSPMFDTTNLETLSLDAFFSFQFYCNSSSVNFPISLNPKIPVSSGTSNPTYTPTIFGTTNAPGYGCSALALKNGLSSICCSTPVINSVVISPFVFIVAILTLAGWVIFSVFCGVGMTALSYDLYNEFKHRAKPITAQTYNDRKKQVGMQAGILMDEYKILSGELKAASRGGNFNRKYVAIKNRENTFRKNVIILEYHYKMLEEAYRNQGGNAILQYSKAFGAVISAILTLLWLIHCALYVLPNMIGSKIPLNLFLNSMLISTANAPIIGIVLYAIFVFYLLACTMKGNAKIGMRLVFFTIHPLVIGETLMSAMVFNAGIILLCSLPICQFAQIAFAAYSAGTPNQSIFGVQITSLSSLGVGYDVFIWVMLIFCVLTFFYNMYSPYSKQKENQLALKWD